jgi:hypothetical protein
VAHLQCDHGECYTPGKRGHFSSKVSILRYYQWMGVLCCLSMLTRVHVRVQARAILLAHTYFHHVPPLEGLRRTKSRHRTHLVTPTLCALAGLYDSAIDDVTQEFNSLCRCRSTGTSLMNIGRVHALTCMRTAAGACQSACCASCRATPARWLRRGVEDGCARPVLVYVGGAALPTRQ